MYCSTVQLSWVIGVFANLADSTYHCELDESSQTKQPFFMLHDLVFLGYHSYFASYLYSIASYSYSCELLQPYVAATVQMHSDAVFSSMCASRIKTFMKNQCLSTNSGSL